MLDSIIIEKIHSDIKEKLKKPIFQLAFVTKSLKPIKSETNHRLELVGDKVLGLILYDRLYPLKHIDCDTMDRMRSSYLSRYGLGFVYDNLKLKNLENYVQIAKNQEINDEIKHTIIEAIFGAIYIDEGYEAANKYWDLLNLKYLFQKYSEK